MSSQVEWSIRSKIADIQVFLTSNECSEKDLAELDRGLDSAMAVINKAKQAKEAGGE